MKKILFILLTSFLFSQDFNLSGKIISKDSFNPISDVNIMIQDTELGTASNRDGLFQFSQLKSGKYELIISAIGYQDQYLEINLNRNISDLSIQLENEFVLVKNIKCIRALSFKASTLFN